MFTNYVENGVGSFDLVDESMRTHFDPGLQRPMCASNGRTYFIVNTGQTKEDGTPLRKNIWKEDLENMPQVHQLLNGYPRLTWVTGY